MSHLYLEPSFAVCDSWQKTYTLFCMYTPLMFLPYLNEIIRIFYHFDQMAMSQLYLVPSFVRLNS